MNKPPEAQSRRLDIQHAALQLFGRRGYHGTSMQDIARAVGLTKATLYWHFVSKEDLFRSVYEDFVHEVMRPLIQILESAEPPEIKLQRIVEQSIALAREQPDSVRVLFQLTSQAELADIVARLLTQQMAHVVEFLAPLFAALGDPDPPATARLFASTVDGLMSHVLIDPDIMSEADIVAAVTRCFLPPRPAPPVGEST